MILNNKKILVAEDNAINRELLRELLDLRDYQIVEAADGAEALRKLEEFDPSIVLLDIQMPVLDGFAVIQRMRSDPRYNKVYAIALTAYAMRGDREKALAAGFDEYVTKPIDSALLYSILEAQSNNATPQERRLASVGPRQVA